VAARRRASVRSSQMRSGQAVAPRPPRCPGEQRVQHYQETQVHSGHSKKHNIIAGKVSPGMHCVQEYNAFDAPSAMPRTCYLVVGGLKAASPEELIAMPISTPEKRLLLFGASRGLGLAIAEEYLKLGWRVVATARQGARTPLHGLVDNADGRLDIEIIDITDPAQVTTLHGRLESEQFDLLFVNAGVTNGEGETIADVSTEEFVRVMVTNALSPMRVIETFRNLVRSTGAIAVMSSRQGSVSNNETGGYEVYRASKAALNTLMRSFAARHSGDLRTLLLLAPGWVRTDLGGAKAPLSIQDSIPNLVKVIQAQEGKGGLQFLDYLGRAVSW
jgi:NAD(P)-dependent dehydrogenase (short-subunit alcohol dehydrogenase family)